MRSILAAVLILLGGCQSVPKGEVLVGRDFPLPRGHWAMSVNKCCGSMRPALQGGETIYVSLPRPGEALLGKIVDNGKVTHRVVGETKTHVVMAGDANPAHDFPPTPKREIRFVIRYVVNQKAAP